LAPLAANVEYTIVELARFEAIVQKREALALLFIPGHEGAGIVAAVGPGVTGLREGDAVGVAWVRDACGGCQYCETGWETLCEAQHMSGYTVNGSFAEYVIGAAPYVVWLPKNADFAELAPILCAGVTTYKGIKETEAKPGKWLAISGVGGLGHIAIQYAKAIGLHVAALNVTDEKLSLARGSRSVWSSHLCHGERRGRG
jgi:propanol-preferring alcohol dehydrogenase